MVERLQVDNISFGYGTRQLFRGLSCSMSQGECVGITGRSGAGKSSFLEICAALQFPENGRILWNGVDPATFTRKNMNDHRKSMGFLFQTSALVHNYPIFENCALPLRRHFRLSESEISDRIGSILDRLGIQHAARLLPDMVSYGEARCAALARALVGEPDLLFLDEPISGLDPETAHRVTSVIADYHQSKKTTIVLVSHSAFLLRTLQSTVYLLAEKRLHPLHDDSGIPPEHGYIAEYLKDRLRV